MTNDYRNGDVEIITCKLYSASGSRELDILPNVRTIDIYESVLQPTIIGEIRILDDVNLLRGFPIIGEEYVKIKFRTPSLKQVDLTLYVIRVQDIEANFHERFQTFNLVVASKELLTNAAKRITKRYNDQISSTIKTIMTNELSTDKKIEIEQTKGIDDHLVNNLTPLQAIDKLRHRAVSSSNKSSSYVFYENVEGFHFKTLEKIIVDKRGKVADKAFFYDDNIDVTVEQARFRDIIKLDQAQQVDTISKLQAGGIRNTVRRFDILTGEVKDIDYQESDEFKKTGDVPKSNTSRFRQQHNQPARKFFVPFDSSQDNQVPEKVGILHSFVEKVTQNMTYALIYGDSEITVGDMISARITTATGLTSDSSKRTVTNNYIVAKVRHMIVNSSRPTYTQSLELINNSLDSNR